MAQSKQDQETNKVKTTISTESEIERLRRDVYRSDKEKFQLLVQMFHANAMYNRAKVTHK